MEQSVQQNLGWLIAGLVSVVAYFLKREHTKTEQEIKKVDLKTTNLELKLAQLETKQIEYEKQTQGQIASIEKWLDTRLTGLEDYIKRIDSNVEKLSNR